MNSFNFMKDTTEQAKQKLLASNWEQKQDADQNELAELNRQEYLEELNNSMKITQLNQITCVMLGCQGVISYE